MLFRSKQREESERRAQQEVPVLTDVVDGEEPLDALEAGAQSRAQESEHDVRRQITPQLHDIVRRAVCRDLDERYPQGSYVPGASTTAPRKPFMSMPTRCTGSFATTMHTRSWLEQDRWLTATIDKDVNGEPFEARGCENVPFKPSIEVLVEEEQADTPTGFGLELSLPQNEDPDGPATAHLKRAVVTLPEGMAINPASAAGRASCAPTQIKLNDASVPRCPDGSKLGTVEIDTPLLQEPLKGGIYLAKQTENPFGSMLAIYLVAEGPGVVIKLPGRIEADSATGRVTASFDDNPQLPFDTLSVEFEGGARAPLVTPPNCGAKIVSGTFSSWAMPGDATASSEAFQITSGPNGEACPGGRFDPKLTAGTLSAAAGQHSPFVIRLSREDGTQRLAGLDLTLPKGLLGKLAGIPYCPDASLAAVSAAQGSGASQIAAPSCPAASQVGTVSVGTGAGPSPLYVNTGKAYLAGPYKGAPLSLAIVTPAVAGPYDLGSVVVRTALHIDPMTAQLNAVSDPIPTILHGIPLNLRDLRIDIDRPGFTLNPTGCEQQAVSGLARSAAGFTATLSEPFQAVNCADLGFAPKLSFRYKGKTHRSAHPAVTATLKTHKDDANIGKAVVTLPKTQFLEQGHIRTICTRVQYAANTCPKASVYGYAKAWTPLLEKPLQGPVYLRSSSNTLPDLVADLNGQIEIDLSGRIDSVNERMRVTFAAVPDAPVSKFVLRMQGGKKGLLVNNTELCEAKPRVSAVFTGQNGKRSVANPLVKVDCGKGAGNR